jgi:prolyl-tRNA synthetase
VLYDDTDERAGGKFATMDVIGLPYQVVIGPKGVKAGEAEIKTRNGGAKETIAIDAAVAKVIDLVKAGRDLA